MQKISDQINKKLSGLWNPIGDRKYKLDVLNDSCEKLNQAKYRSLLNSIFSNSDLNKTELFDSVNSFQQQIVDNYKGRCFFLEKI